MSNCGEFVSCQANVADSAIRPPKVPDSISEQPLRRNLKLFRGGLVFKAHRLLYDSTLGSKVMKKEEEEVADSASIIYIYIYLYMYIVSCRAPAKRDSLLFWAFICYMLDWFGAILASNPCLTKHRRENGHCTHACHESSTFGGRRGGLILLSS